MWNIPNGHQKLYSAETDNYDCYFERAITTILKDGLWAKKSK
jgi:hypothetical protein